MVDREFGRLQNREGLPNEGSEFIMAVPTFGFLHLCFDVNFVDASFY